MFAEFECFQLIQQHCDFLLHAFWYSLVCLESAKKGLISQTRQVKMEVGVGMMCYEKGRESEKCEEQGIKPKGTVETLFSVGGACPVVVNLCC